jgi:acyl carrier protein
MRRGGVEALTDERGLELFDEALGADRATALAIPIDVQGLRALASAGALPPIFGGLVRSSKRPRAGTGSLAAKLATLPEAEHESYVLDLVRGEVAAVLGHASAEAIEPDRAFQELGFDSLAAVELRNRLGAIAGVRLSATVVFDHPSPAAVASRLLIEVGADDWEDSRRDGEIRDLLAKLETTLSSLEPSHAAHERASTRLRSLLVNLTNSGELDGDGSTEDLASMSHEEMFELIDEEFGGR